MTDSQLPGPAKLTPEVINGAADAIARGVSQSEVCRLLRVGRTTWFRWLREGTAHHDEGVESRQAELHVAISEARAGLQQKLTASIIVAALGHREKADWRAAAWMLERGWPQEFGGPAHRIEAHHTHEPPAPAPEPIDPREFRERMITEWRRIHAGGEEDTEDE